MLPTMLGIFLLSLLWYVAAWMVMASTALLQAFGAVLLFAVALYTTYPALAGLGAAFLTGFGFRAYVGTHSGGAGNIDAPTPAPPPLPESPPTITPTSGPVPSSLGQSNTPPPLSSGEE